MGKVVGILANTIGFNSNDPFDDKYYVQNTYVESVKKAGGIPIIIPPVNLVVNKDALDLCDAFLLIGGIKVWQYHLDVIDYAIKHNKKLLGICMGMQAIAMYSNSDIEEKILYEVSNHYYDEITHKNKELLVHDVKFEKGSTLEKLLGSELDVNSMHHYAVKKVNKPFKVVGKYNDIIEAIEYKNIIGVQFHPELLKSTEVLFKWLIDVL